jgi:hypothetical protein
VTARRRPTPAEIVAASSNDNGKAVVSVPTPDPEACAECGFFLPSHDWNCSKVPAGVERPQAALREDVSSFSLSASPGEPHLPGVAEWLAKTGRKS